MNRYPNADAELAQRLAWQERAEFAADRRRYAWAETAALVEAAAGVRDAWKVRPTDSWLDASKSRLLDRFDHLQRGFMAAG